MDVIPATHTISARHTTSADIQVRYEDIAQDGRFRLEGMPECLGRTVWTKLIGPSKLYRQLSRQGITPVLTRLGIEGGQGPISIEYPLKATGRFRFSHSLDDDAEVQRILLNMWGEVTGPRASTRDPQPPGVGEQITVGRIFAEHTLTRPFATPGERRVRSLRDIPGISPYPRAEYLGEAPRALAALPRAAEPLEPLSLDREPVAFGIDDTDANQHVNSLAYPRLLRGAVLRRLAKLGLDTKVMMRSVEIAFRKPNFAGDTAYIRVRTFRYNGHYGATCTLGAEDPDATPHCFARMLFGS